MLSAVSVRQKLLLPLILLCLACAGLEAYSLSVTHHVMTMERLTKSRALIQLVVAQFGSIDAEIHAGKLDEATGVERMRQIIRTTRYGNGDYFTLFTTDGTVVAHPLDRKLEGSNRIDLRDSDGYDFNRQLFLATARDGEGQVSYRFPRPEDKVPIRKTTFASLYKPRGWIVATGVYLADIDDAFWREAVRVGSFAAAAIFLVLGIAYWIQRDVVRALLKVTRTLSHIVAGESTEVADVRSVAARRDEIGQLGRAVAVFETKLQENRLLLDGQAEQRHAEAARLTLIEGSTRDLQSALGEALGALSSGASGLSQAASEMQSTAAMTMRNSDDVATSAQRAAMTTQGLAAAIEQMITSASEIEDQMTRSAEIAATARSEAARTNDVVNQLSSTFNQVTDVVGLINSIAEKTNLLALNATIEAARAGTYGKGFAVVAAEVKALATQTGSATDTIRNQVLNMQDALKDANTFIAAIVARVDDVGASAVAVRRSIMQQNAATREVAASSEYAAREVQTVGGAAQEISRATHGVDSGAARIGATASELVRLGDTIERIVSTFTQKIR